MLIGKYFIINFLLRDFTINLLKSIYLVLSKSLLFIQLKKSDNKSSDRNKFSIAVVTELLFFFNVIKINSANLKYFYSEYCLALS
jgi:hypothetical protein